MTTEIDRRAPYFRAAGAWLRTTPGSQSMAYYAAFIALGFAGAVLGPTLPGLAGQTRSAVSQISYLFTAHALGYLIGSFMAGRLYDRAHLAGHRIMAGMLVIMAAMMCLVPTIPLLWILTAAVLALGSAEGILDVGGNTLIVWVHGSKVGPFMNALHFAWGVGALVAPIFVAQAILRSGTIAWAYWGLALLMVPPAIALWRVRSPANPFPTEQEKIGPKAGAKTATRLLVLVVFFFFLFVGAETSMGGWITSYGIARGLTAANAAYLASAFWGFFTLARALSIPMARFSPSMMLFAELALCLVGSASLLLWPHSTSVLWLGTILFGLGMAAVFPTTVTHASSLMPISGRVTSWFFVGSSLGGMTIPWIIGQLFRPVGPQAVPFVVSGAIAASIVMLVVLSREARRVAPAGEPPYATSGSD